MLRIQFFSLAILVTFLTGCASTGGYDGDSVSRHDKKIAACIASARQTEWLVFDVPAANSSIANKMAAATMAMGGSNSVDTLVKVLSEPARSAVAVVGNSDELTVATLQAALNELVPGAHRSAQPVCFVGQTNDDAKLESAAARAGIHLLILPR